MVSLESTDGTNSLLMNSPVGTLIFLPVAATVISVGWAMLARCRWEDRRARRGKDKRGNGIVQLRQTGMNGV